MQPSLNSIHFLWTAYILVVVANVGFALWLRSLWVKLNARKG
jgi:hypothetical protein